MYSGDANNLAAVSSCAAAPLTVRANASSTPPVPPTAIPPTPAAPPAPPIAVSQNDPTISTQLSATSVAIGGSAHDTATLSGASATATGSVTYSVYDNATCTSGGGGLVATLGPVSVANGAVPDSPGWTATGSAGTYYFVAFYMGVG